MTVRDEHHAAFSRLDAVGISDTCEVARGCIHRCDEVCTTARPRCIERCLEFGDTLVVDAVCDTFIDAVIDTGRGVKGRETKAKLTFVLVCDRFDGVDGVGPFRPPHTTGTVKDDKDVRCLTHRLRLVHRIKHRAAK